MDDLGPLIRRLRQNRGWSQDRLAQVACKISGRPTLTRQEIQRYETGKRHPKMWMPFLARALGVQQDELERAAARCSASPEVTDRGTSETAGVEDSARNSGIAQESQQKYAKRTPVNRREFVELAGAALFHTAAGDRTAVERIAAALTHYATASEPSSTGADLQNLRESVRGVKQSYQTCRYERVTERLPELLRQLDHASVTVDSDQQRHTHTLRAEAYHVASSVLLKLEELGLAWLAADRSMQAAQLSEDPVTIGSSARIVTHALLKSHHYRAATDFATRSAKLLTASSGGPTACDSVYGALLLRGSVAAARLEDRAHAHTLLEEAHEVGRRLGRDRNVRWTAFGPTNVLLHRVNTSVLLGDAGDAISQAQRIRLDNIDVLERKVTLFVDLARAYAQWGKLDKAHEALVMAEQLAQEELTTRPAVRTLITDIQERSSGHLRRDMDALATRIGLDT